ncbi:Piwi domain-containing protein [Alternaria rosae]|uniref:Piwi domain-containing protein n=1 Tax=Alternaria rosae TaxID=1187941 RepID=UPI001E8CB003|nr:Piwi domain-containing protein [Alternaria rosae]KAH6883189.1 Piwi domain-containing protein [Alternaria rosae]
MTFDPKTIFYEYHLIGIPASESRAGKKRYTETIIQNVPFLNTNRTLFATDNAATIISWINLHQYATGVRVATGDPVTGVGGAWRLLDIVDRNTTTRLTLQYSGQVDIAGLQSYANTTHPNTATYDPSPAETALNTIIATCITSNNTLHLNNHKFYVRDAFRDLRTSENNAIAPLRPLLVSEVLQHGSGPFGGDVEDVKRALKNVRVYINYYRDSKDQKTGAPSLDVQHARLKTIRNFGLACSAQTFLWECKDTQGNPIAGHRANVTVQDYQSRQYGRTLRHPGSPAVNIGTNLAPTWFAPEDLRIVPDQIYAKIIPDAVANDFHRDACRRPNEIRSRIEQEGLVHIPITPQPHNLLRCASISVNPTMLQIPSVHLQYPTVQYSGATTKKANHSGRWNLQNAKFLQPKTENVTWKLIVESGIEDNSVNILTQHFDLQLIQTGVTLTASRQGAPLILPLNATETDLQNTIATYLEDLAKQEELKQKQEPVPVPDIFVLLLCRKDQNLYSSFKYLADRVFAVQSICMTETNMTAPGGNITQYMANIAMKANLKMAGINHSSPGIETWMKNTLVLGADCTHPGSAALLGSPSVAAVVGSLEANGGRFRGKLKLQKGKQEIITDLGDFLLDHFRDWYTWHKQKFPENVLYYRDGVSTSQYDEVLRVELAGIEEAFQKLVTLFGGGNVKKPKITAVIVNKRHSTRFFPRQQGDAIPGNGNCKPGLLVESSITSPCYTDFYLQSHNGIKGTARSTHYTVIRNHMAMSTTQLEDLTHKLNHTYVRATLGVSYAAPAYYADRLCERARCYLRTWYNPNPSMRNNYQNLIRQCETTVETKRNNSNANRPPRLRGHKKTDVEIAEEKKDAAEVHEALEEWLKPRMRARFVGELHDVANNDAGRKRQMNMLRTMYWM